MKWPKASCILFSMYGVQESVETRRIPSFLTGSKVNETSSSSKINIGYYFSSGFFKEYNMSLVLSALKTSLFSNAQSYGRRRSFGSF